MLKTINLQSRKVTNVLYFNFKKAFDSVSHLKLLNKLQAYGIVGNLLAWISDFLSSRCHVSYAEEDRVGSFTLNRAYITNSFRTDKIKFY